MTTNVRRIQVGPRSISAKDVIEYAKHLIQIYGWNSTSTGYKTSDEDVGFTLHDAIGEACTRLSKASTGTASKDWTVQNQQGVRNLRTEASAAVNAAIADSGFAPEGASRDDYGFNDKAKDANEIIAILDAAAGKVAE